MATSSMHKPGWRSRRRSRLSLVERAVPRLGRTPGSGDDIEAKPNEAPVRTESPPRIENTSEPVSIAKADTEAPAADGDVRLVHTTDAVDDEQSLIAEEDASLRQMSDDADEPPAEARTEVLVDDESVVTQDRTEAPGPEPGTQAVSMLDDETAGRAEAEPAALSSEMPPAVTEPPALENVTVDDTVPPPVLAVAADAPSTPTGQNPETSSKDGTLRLDWDDLIENGFVDPRDRGRPLAPNMDEIVRVLLRQALSDQASWRDRVILVTSPTERASKSTAAINFSLGLTTVGDHRTVLVDVDTTGPGAVERLGGTDRTGISEALADSDIGIDDLIVKTDLDRLTLVPSGPSDEELLDRFASHRMLTILRFLTENPDTLLIIDAPPILASQEAAVLSVVAGQVVMAVEAGVTTADQIEHALQRIGERHNVSLVLVETSGIVREDMPPQATAARNAPADRNRRAPLVKRRPSKFAAVAAGAVALGLFLSNPVGDTTSTVGYAQLIPGVATIAAVPPERLSFDDLASGSSFRQMGR